MFECYRSSNTNTVCTYDVWIYLCICMYSRLYSCIRTVSLVIPNTSSDVRRSLTPDKEPVLLTFPPAAGLSLSYSLRFFAKSASRQWGRECLQAMTASRQWGSQCALQCKAPCQNLVGLQLTVVLYRLAKTFHTWHYNRNAEHDRLWPIWPARELYPN